MRHDRCGWTVLGLLGLVLLGVAAPGSRAEPPPPGAAGEVRARHVEAAHAAAARGDLDAEIAAVEAVLSIDASDPEAAGDLLPDTLTWLADLRERRGELVEAGTLLERARARQAERFGPDDWRTADARRALEDLDHRGAWPAAGRDAEREARALLDEARRLHDEGRYDDAQGLASRACGIRARWWGPDHVRTAEALADLGVIERARADYGAARRALGRAVDVARAGLGDHHPLLGRWLDALASVEASMGAYDEALPRFREALAILDGTVGLDGLEAARTRNNLAAALGALGDADEAGRLYAESLATHVRVLGGDHPDTATAMANLATNLVGRGRLPEARTLYERALEIRRTRLGPDHPDVAATYNQLGSLFLMMGEPRRARAMLRAALDIRERRLGPDHPLTTVTLANLARLEEITGTPEAATPIYEAVLARRLRRLGPAHPAIAAAVADVARLRAAAGDVIGATALLGPTLEALRASLDRAFGVLSERQQLELAASYRPVLDLWLDLAPRAGVSATRLHDALLRWKGTVYARQAAMRAAREDPAVAQAFDALAAVGTELSRAVSRGGATTGGDPDEIARLTARWESLESDLAARSAGFRDLLRASRATSQDIATALPSGVLLVDLFVHGTGGARFAADRPGAGLTAFLVRHGQETVRLDLGAFEDVAEAVATWRRSNGPTVRPDAAAAARLRERLWLPLLPYLDGVEVVLVAPDDVISLFPFAALPGTEPDTFLVEEPILVATCPAPSWLPVLLGDGPPRADPSLLVIGQVDYGPIPDPAGPVDGGRAAPRFRPLPATRSEILAIEDSFEQRFPQAPPPRALRGREATKALVLEEARTHRWVHLATHGYADAGAEGTGGRGAPAFLPLDLGPHVGVAPGLRSGLALADANRTDPRAGNPGLLTALEVAAADLRHVDLVVLSACETAMGDVVRGEGVLSLQRAFQVAQARATVASLWRVPDDATHSLMVRFYEALWRDEPITALEALRAAQRWMLSSKGDRGPLEPEADEHGGRLPPFFWAGFVLAGDWR